MKRKERKNVVIKELFRCVKMDIDAIRSFIETYDSGNKARSFAYLGEVSSKRIMTLHELLDKHGGWLRRLEKDEARETKSLINRMNKKEEVDRRYIG